MSQWTHVSGCIRIDRLPIGGSDTERREHIRKCFGNPVSFDDDKSAWDACGVPCGSEGSLQYNVKHVGDKHSLIAFNVNIWGDLRDYDNPDAIVSWLTVSINLLKEAGMFLRDLVVKINVEGRDPIVVLADDGKISEGDGYTLKQVVIDDD